MHGMGCSSTLTITTILTYIKYSFYNTFHKVLVILKGYDSSAFINVTGKFMIEKTHPHHTSLEPNTIKCLSLKLVYNQHILENL